MCEGTTSEITGNLGAKISSQMNIRVVSSLEMRAKISSATKHRALQRNKYVSQYNLVNIYSLNWEKTIAQYCPFTTHMCEI